MKRIILLAIGIAVACTVIAIQHAHANRPCGLSFWQVGQTCETKDGRTCMFQSDNTFRCTKRPKTRAAKQGKADAVARPVGARKIGGRIQFDISRYAVAGVRTRISFLTNLAPDCSSTKMRTRVALKPSSGSVEVEDNSGFPGYSKDNPRSKCNTIRVPGASVFYTPQQDFLGVDKLEIAAISENGTLAVYKFTITVQPEPAGAPPAPNLNDGGAVIERIPITGKKIIQVMALINGVKGEFIVDTGATDVSLSYDFATRAGVKFDASRTIAFNTANGTVQKYFGMADTIKLGALNASGVRVAVSQRGSPDFIPGKAIGLLGMSFLSRFDLHFSESELRISSRVPSPPPSLKSGPAALRQKPETLPQSETPAMAAAREWQDVKGSNSRAALEAFRKRHEGDPVYSALADEAIRKLALSTPVVPEGQVRSGPLPEATPRPTIAVPGMVIDSSSMAPRPAQLHPGGQSQAPQPQRQAAVQPQRQPTAALDPASIVVPGSGASFRDCPDCPEMVVVPAGSFMMGSPASEPGRASNEGPQRRVTIAKPFAVGKFEVTFAEWDACVSEGACKHKPEASWGSGRQPVMRVSWDDITKEYLPWLSRRTGKTYRLLSEADWEYAARAGTTTPFSFGQTISTDEANYNGDYTYGGGRKGVYRQKTIEVGSLNKPNAWGLHDMHGNVWEWVADCYKDSYAGAPTDGSATADTAACARVLRGGSWVIIPQYLRSAIRYSVQPDLRNFSVGFRLARSIDMRDDSASLGVPASPQKGLVNGDVKAVAPADSKADMPAEANGPGTRETRGHSKDLIVITVTRDGAMLLGEAEKTPITLDEIGTRLRAIANARGTDEPIFIRGANEAAYGHFAEVMARIQQAGFKRVSLVIDGHAPPPVESQKKLTVDQAAMLNKLVRQQVSRCWNINTGLEGIDKIVIQLEVKMKPDGTLAQPPTVVGNQVSPTHVAAAGSAVRAVVQCAPYTLPADLYSGGWDYMVVTFDPKRMF